jgi:fido (protein-threonine AMPylation protein)
VAAPSEKLAQSLEVLRKLQNANKAAAIRADDISRTHRERLVKNGFLKEVIKGWFIPTRPDEPTGDSTSWYASYWKFVAAYLDERFGKNWCLSPEQSLMIHSGNWTVPQQLLVRSPQGKNNSIALPFNTSLFDISSALPAPRMREEKEGLRIYTLSAALIESSPRLFTSDPTDMRTALAQVKDASDLLQELLSGGNTVIAGRLAGAFRNIGRDRIADDILSGMRSAHYAPRETDPFTSRIGSAGTGREVSPYVLRIKMMWHAMRENVINNFPKAPGIPKNKTAYLKHIAEVYVTDAYHSLSIEGYVVTPELIERVRTGKWNPDEGSDKEQRNALAARGYWQAYQSVLKSVDKILKGKNPGQIADANHGAWYRELFAPSVAVGLLKPSDLAGYRNGPVYIRKSMHVPLNRDAVRDAMPTFFELLRKEKDPAVRVVLGHFIFVYIHPYMDCNGRVGRFMMNAMLAAGGYPWTVVPVEGRTQYMEALEQASVNQNIVPFADFLGKLVSKGMKGKPVAKMPKIEK